MVKPLSGHRQITDAYLLSLAISHKGRLVSFDAGITALVPEQHRGNLVIVDILGLVRRT
jgi:predicted nucleic acid-binding protein